MTPEPLGLFHGIQWWFARTINRKTGVVMAEDYTAELTEITLNRPFKGHSPKEVLTVFFYWDPERTSHMVNYIACSLDLEMYLSITSELLNLFLNDSHLIRDRHIARLLAREYALLPMVHTPRWQPCKSHIGL